MGADPMAWSSMPSFSVHGIEGLAWVAGRLDHADADIRQYQRALDHDRRKGGGYGVERRRLIGSTPDRHQGAGGSVEAGSGTRCDRYIKSLHGTQWDKQPCGAPSPKSENGRSPSKLPNSSSILLCGFLIVRFGRFVAGLVNRLLFVQLRETVAVMPAESTRSGGRSSISIRTGTRWASGRTQVKDRVDGRQSLNARRSVGNRNPVADPGNVWPVRARTG